MKILETERLLLRGLEQGDFKDVCKLLQDDEVMYAYEGAFNDQEVQNLTENESLKSVTFLERSFGIRALLSKLLSLVGSMLSIRLVSKRSIRSYGIPILLPKK